jgi:hypothetical protein
MVTITVQRESACAADDQVNPLTLRLEVSKSETLAGLIEQILSNRFLQFSSSHAIMNGLASDRPIVTLHADLLGRCRTEFLIPPDTPIDICLPMHQLTFSWATQTIR